MINFTLFKKLRDFLSSRYGIFIDDEKLGNIYKRKFLSVMNDFGYKNFENFYKDIIFQRDSKLIEKIIEVITVNETYFFRENYQFDTLIKYIIPELDKTRPKNESINILSAPCSTGEEIYSIAIYLLEEKNFIKNRDFLLLGIDIDKQVIEKAKMGFYSERSVHKLPRDIVNKYFIKKGEFYQVKDILKNAVNFKVINVLDKYAMKKLGKFDVIFSRNMLIYFNENNKREAINNFYSILKPNGFLFLGHAEMIPKDIKLFKKEKLGEAFVYRKV